MNTEQISIASIAEKAIRDVLGGVARAGENGIGDVVIHDSASDDRQALYRIILPELAGVTPMGNTIGLDVDVAAGGRAAIRPRIVTEDYETPKFRPGGSVNIDIDRDCESLAAFVTVPRIDVTIGEGGPELNLSTGTLTHETIDFHRALIDLAMELSANLAESAE